MVDMRVTRTEAEKILESLRKEMSDKFCPVLDRDCLTTKCVCYRDGRVYSDPAKDELVREGRETLGCYTAVPPRCTHRDVRGRD